MGFYNAFAEMVADIRQKVVEEPWFGREVTGNTVDIGHAEITDHQQNNAAPPSVSRSYETYCREDGLFADVGEAPEPLQGIDISF